MTFNFEKGYINVISAIAMIFTIGGLIWTISDFKHTIERSIHDLENTVKGMQTIQSQLKETVWTGRDMFEWCLAVERINKQFRCPSMSESYKLRLRAGANKLDQITR